jgi:Transglutaminase-like superfamily
MKIWHRFWRLSGAERGIALEAAAALTATWAGLRLFGFRHWNNLLARLATTGSQNLRAPGPGTIESARAIACLEGSAARSLLLRTNCLEQSLVLWWLLRRRGMDVEIRMGARKEAGRFEAHAWVEFDGMVLNVAGDEHIHFVPFEEPANSMGTQTH